MTQVWTQADSEQLRVKAQQLPVLREAAGLDMMFYRTQVETKVVYMTQVETKVDGA